MTCDELTILLHGYVDGELDLMRHLEVEKHLTDCSSCARAWEKLLALQMALRSSNPDFMPPADLHRRIERSLADLDAPPRPRRRPWGWLGLAAAAALLVVGIVSLARTWSSGAEDRLAGEVVAGHVRSLLIEEHLCDVRSSDQHTVKPWFHGKIDFAPPVHDFGEEGFSLVGGRLDYLDGRTAAVLIYHRRKHVINLFLWSSPRVGKQTPRDLTRQGYNLLHWWHGGLTCWAISDLNAAELRTFADLVVRQAEPATP